ncbi:MAG: hypothetical protein NE327_10990 [Lentisphaeraceae bacterium]|nr:hypothetical protein [Lentisphaeraceae bacterium]
MKLHWAVPIKKKLRIYISIIAVSFFVLKSWEFYSNFRASKKIFDSGGSIHLLKTKTYFKNIPYFDKNDVLCLAYPYFRSTQHTPLDTSIIKKLTRLDALSYNGNHGPINFQDLTSVNGIVYVDISNCRQTEPETTLYVTNPTIKHLMISNCELDHIVFSKGLNLEVLILRNSRIKSLKGVENLTKLKELDLVNLDVSDISPLENCKNLEILEMHGSHIPDLSPLTQLPKLKKLSVAVHENLDVIKRLKSLKELNLWYFSPILNVNHGIEELKKIEDIEKQIKKDLPDLQFYYIYPYGLQIY